MASLVVFMQLCNAIEWGKKGIYPALVVTIKIIAVQQNVSGWMRESY